MIRRAIGVRSVNRILVRALEAGVVVDETESVSSLLEVVSNSDATDVLLLDLTAFSAAWRSKPTWLFGVLGYDLKNAMEPTAFSRHSPEEGEPDLEFFEPEWVLTCSAGRLVLHQHPAHPQTADSWWERVQSLATSNPGSKSQITRDWTPTWPAATYLERARSLQNFMMEGDLYEVNLCAMWEAQAHVDPLQEIGRAHV